MESILTMTWHETTSTMLEAVAAHGNNNGWVVVAARLPLLTDLTVAANIALPRQYHLGVNNRLAHLQACELVARLLPIAYAEKYPNTLTTAETFAVLWLRAIAVPKRTVVLESPLASFALDESTLRDSIMRCYGLFRHVYAHELSRWRKLPQLPP